MAGCLHVISHIYCLKFCNQIKFFIKIQIIKGVAAIFFVNTLVMSAVMAL